VVSDDILYTFYSRTIESTSKIRVRSTSDNSEAFDDCSIAA